MSLPWRNRRPSRPSTPRHPVRAAALVAVAVLVGAAPARAQDTLPWNSPRALELVARARALRHGRVSDTTLHSYSAVARGHVYFLVDRPDTDERTLVKADQIALEVYWKAPDRTRQRIVGRRDKKVLPTNIHYHLDHLTVVQDEFEDRIRIGDGDEVSTVVHPVAPGSEKVYDFRLADSLTLSFGGTRPEVRVYEVQVRPRNMDAPGFVGSIYLDRATAAIVRMTFTFTPASYNDPYLDYIRIVLDNSLWEGTHWLPYRQEVEIRREFPELDFLVGSIIKGRFDIGDYKLNPDLPPGLFVGPRITTVSEAEQKAFPFQEPLIPPDEAAHLAPTPSLEEVKAAARRVVGRRALSGLHRFRLHAAAVSDVFRFDRAEGAFVGIGFGWHPAAGAHLTADGGWSFGRRQPSLTLALTAGGEPPVTAGRLMLHQLRDMGPFPGASGVMNSLSTLLGGEDYLDPWFASGAAVTHDLRGLGFPLEVTARAERQRSARYVVGGAAFPAGADRLRPVRPIEDGDMLAADATLTVGSEDGAALHVTASAGRFAPTAPFQGRPAGDPRGWSRVVGGLTWTRANDARPLQVRASVDGGLASAGAPAQELFLLGGRGTLLGQPYRAFVGDRFWLARASLGRTVAAPWLSLRAFGAVGQATLEHHPLVPAAWDARPHAGVKGSLGVGAGLAWDIVQVDVGRGVGGGGWGTAVSFSRRFQGWL